MFVRINQWFKESYLMKKIILLLSVAVLFLYSCGQERGRQRTGDSEAVVIAIMEDGKTTFLHKKALLAQLESALKQHTNMDVRVTDLSIDYSSAVDNEEVSIIQLIGSDAYSSIRISYQLVEVAGKFSLMPKSTVLVCEGCRSGCSPKRKSNGDGYCTKCDYNGATPCVKIEADAYFSAY